jgi:hypothetical protein
VLAVLLATVGGVLALTDCPGFAAAPRALVAVRLPATTRALAAALPGGTAPALSSAATHFVAGFEIDRPRALKTPLPSG